MTHVRTPEVEAKFIEAIVPKNPNTPKKYKNLVAIKYFDQEIKVDGITGLGQGQESKERRLWLTVAS